MHESNAEVFMRFFSSVALTDKEKEAVYWLCGYAPDPVLLNLVLMFKKVKAGK